MKEPFTEKSNNTILNRTIRAVLAALLFGLGGCKVVNYSFSGVTIDCTKEPTMSVETFVDNSEGGPASLSQDFTEALREYYQSNTCLALTNFNADYQINGSIIGYNLSPQAPSGEEQALLMRLTITVKVDYLSPSEENSFEGKTFSFFADYPQDADFSAIEAQLVDEITEQLLLDIFNQTVATW